MIIFIPLLVWAIAHGFKFINRSITTGGLKLHNFLDYGGMPSSHATLASSLATMVGLTEGFRSTTFAISFIVAIFVIHDALRLRRVVEEHSKILNHLREDFGANERHLYPLLPERIGHKFSEVLTGIIFGIMGTVILRLLLVS